MVVGGLVRLGDAVGIGDGAITIALVLCRSLLRLGVLRHILAAYRVSVQHTGRQICPVAVCVWSWRDSAEARLKAPEALRLPLQSR